MALQENSSNSKFMFAAQSHVRNACDACHKRKIRCIVPRSGGPCHNCQSKRLSCYFLPRYRSGRPRIRGHSSPDPINLYKVTPPDSIVNSSIWPAAEKAVPRATASKSPPPRAGHQSSNEDLFAWDSHQDFEIQTEQHSYDLQDSDQPLGFSSVIQQPSFPDFANPTRHVSTNIHSDDLPDATSPSPLGMQTSVWPGASQQPPNHRHPQNETSKQVGFASLLEHCVRLHRHIMTEENNYTMLEENASVTSKTIGMSGGRLQEMLEDIDASCKLMLEMCDEGTSSKSTSVQINSPLDSALICLITTVTFKVYQICDILFDSQGLGIRSIKDVLLQKRLDFNITQARIVTARIEHLTQNSIHISQELSKRAAHIEERFTTQHGGSFTNVGKFRS